MRIVYVIGARPNIVKMAPVLAAMRRRLPRARHVLVHTGQHYDREMSAVLMEDLGVPEPDYALEVGSGSHSRQTAETMQRLEPVLARECPDLVLVAGDVNATFAAALSAAQAGNALAHIESGLRSFDRTMPEERNRVLTDCLSELLFVHCEDAVANLTREAIADDRIAFVGNTMIDSLIASEPRFRSAQVASRLGLGHRDYLLVTLHRPSLVDGPLLKSVVRELQRLSRQLPVVWPVHPRVLSALDGLEPGSGFRLLRPLSYIEFCSLQADAGAVLTDSGGVQEETTYLGVPCFTLRDNTERPVTITLGTNRLLGLDPQRIADIVPALGQRREASSGPPPLWDGQAGERVASVIAERWGVS